MTDEVYGMPEADRPLLEAALTFIRTASEFPECDERSGALLSELRLVLEGLPALPPRELWLELSVDLVPDERDPLATLYRSWGISLYARTLEIFSVYTDRTNPDVLHGDPHEYFWLMQPNREIARVSDRKRDLWIHEVSTRSTFNPNAGITREFEAWRDWRPNWTPNHR